MLLQPCRRGKMSSWRGTSSTWRTGRAWPEVGIGNCCMTSFDYQSIARDAGIADEKLREVREVMEMEAIMASVRTPTGI